MANRILFYSSLICSIVHFIFYLIFIYKITLIYYLHIIFGLLTSLLNHYYTNFYFKWLDRLTIMISVIIDYIFYKNTKHILFLYICVIFYLLEKLNIYHKNILHIISHLVGTTFHILVLLNN